MTGVPDLLPPATDPWRTFPFRPSGGQPGVPTGDPRPTSVPLHSSSHLLYDDRDAKEDRERYKDTGPWYVNTSVSYGTHRLLVRLLPPHRGPTGLRLPAPWVPSPPPSSYLSRSTRSRRPGPHWPRYKRPAPSTPPPPSEVGPLLGVLQYASGLKWPTRSLRGGAGGGRPSSAVAAGTNGGPRTC